MTYELAKQLKDAGFPQPHSKYPDSYLNPSIDEFRAAYIPTLSELISACGDDLQSIEKISTVGWRANFKPEPVDSLVVDRLGYFGKSPEEAVSSLWLKLNQKHE